MNNNFMNSLVSELNNEKCLTENGALAYATSGKKLLDLNFAVSSLRNANETEIVSRFIDAYYENPILAMRWLFYASDVREGLGERRLFRTVYAYLAEKKPDIALALMSLVPEYSRWDNIFVLSETELADDMYRLCYKQLTDDASNMMNNKPISLLAKWLPSVNTSSYKTRELAHKFVDAGKRFGYNSSEKAYRITLSSFRKYLDVVERKMSANQWSEIEYSKVPSKANVKYNAAFWKHDGERRGQFLQKVENGEEKINAGVLFPHDIVCKYSNNGLWCSNVNEVNEFDPALEELWKALPDFVKGNDNTLVIRDGSGSMFSKISNTNVSALDVATALTIYFAEKQSGQFKDKFITFSSKPELIDMSNAKTLHDKLELCYNYCDYSNTDMESTLELLLQTAINGNMTQEDMPNNLLIVSDMEFDYAVRVDGNIFEEYAKKFAEHGYKLPRLVFWNVMSRTGNIPVKENEMGVALVSGFSPIICNMVMSTEIDPFKCLVETISAERYDAVENKIKYLI